MGTQLNLAMHNAFDGKTVFVTGGTGFVGGRLIEKLALSKDITIKALVRNYARAARLARFNVKMIEGSLTDTGTLEDALEDCDIVFHCALDLTSSKLNASALRTMAEASLKAGVERFVYLSSLATYEPLREGELNEDCPYPPTDWDYALGKRDAEKIILNFATERGLPAVILQPTIVYGPFSRNWTDRPVSALLKGQLVLANESEGVCNPVYIDDLVSAILLAALNKSAIGERFLVSGPDYVPWKKFYAAYADIVGKQTFVFESEEQILHSNRLTLKEKLRSLLRPIVHKFISQKMKHRLLGLLSTMKREAGPVISRPNAQELQLYKSKTRVCIDKAKNLLGYNPEYPFDKGMQATAHYIRWAFLDEEANP